METLGMNFRCYYTDGQPCNHYRELSMEDVGKWMDAYKFTHPNCIAITVKVWFDKEEVK